MSYPLEVALTLMAVVAALALIGGVTLWRLQRPLGGYLRGCLRMLVGMCVIAVGLRFLMLPVLAALFFSAVTLVLAIVIGLVRWLLRKPQRRFWRIVGWSHLGLFTIHLFVTFPAFLGWFGSRQLQSRGLERLYDGPRVAADGKLLMQTWGTLRSERDTGKPAVAEDIVQAARQRARSVPSSDGVTIRAYRLEAKTEEPVAVAVLVHGLFRSSMELEPVANMLRDRGCECWLVDQRNHGRSTRAPFTGGLRESDDIVAVVEYVRSQPGRAKTPLVLFGVSLGTIAVSLAIPRIDNVGGVLLDAPIDDLTAAAHRMMTFDRPGDRRSAAFLHEPWRSLILTSLGAWSNFSPTDVSPIEVLATLPHDLPILVVGEELDDRAPPQTVKNLYERMPQHEGVKELWQVPNVGHGRAFLELPAAFDEAVGRLLARLRPTPR
ncbi:MAG: pimeloyl-ACP methyl ester carboxylesterase [Neolewinella sp.]|jgi:pimeloyl-ACP methyl ester carboxylesterase